MANNLDVLPPVDAAPGDLGVAPGFGLIPGDQFATVALTSAMDMDADGDTDVLAASLRSPDDIVGLRRAGVSHFTAAPQVILDLLTDDISCMTNSPPTSWNTVRNSNWGRGVIRGKR